MSILNANNIEIESDIVYNNALDLNHLALGQYLLQLNGEYVAQFNK